MRTAHATQRIYADLAQGLIRRARKLYAHEPLGLELHQTVYALDSTTIDLCLSLFPWARFRSTKAAVKLHTLLDVRGPIPAMITISEGKQADVRILDELIPEPGAFYVLDRGYVDSQRLYCFVLASAFFVTRTKIGIQLHRSESRPVDRSCGLRSDHLVWLNNPQSAAHYPDRLRRVNYRDPENGKGLVFLTNNFDLPAFSIAQLYKLRWRVELFFKWIKQNLRIKHFYQPVEKPPMPQMDQPQMTQITRMSPRRASIFQASHRCHLRNLWSELQRHPWSDGISTGSYGTSDTAVKTQVWIAVCVYVLVAIIRKELALELSLSQMLQISSVNVFEQVPLAEIFAKLAFQDETPTPSNQLMLWN